MRLFVASALLLLGLGAVPNTQAQDLDLPGAELADPGLTECWAYPADPSGDGHAETSGCRTAYSTTNGPADGGSPVTAWPIVGGGGLDPRLG